MPELGVVAVGVEQADALEREAVAGSASLVLDDITVDEEILATLKGE